jgi:hypothetical protein
MKFRQIAVAGCVSVLSTLAFADEAHHADSQPQAVPSKAGGMEMGGMRANMKRMQEQMAQMRSASDPKERDRLVNEHMKTMQDSMSMMHGMMAGGGAMGQMLECGAAEKPKAH